MSRKKRIKLIISIILSIALVIVLAPFILMMFKVNHFLGGVLGVILLGFVISNNLRVLLD